MAHLNIKDRVVDETTLHSYAEGPDTAMAGLCLQEAGVATASRDRYEGIEPGISVRSEMTRRNQEYFRPGERIPRTKNEVILSAENIYRYNGIVHFVIDMMADFVTQGIQIYHPSRAKQKRYRHWWKKVRGSVVSEQLVNLLFCHGTAVVKRSFSVLDPGDIKDLEKGVAARRKPGDSDFERTNEPGRFRIPSQYTFLNPIDVDVLGGPVALFAGDPQYGLKVPKDILRAIKSPKDAFQKAAVAKLPQVIRQLAESGGDVLPLEKDRVSVLFYKKRDWVAAADPIILSIMKDVTLYDRMKDADRAALEGSISRKTLWSLGLPEYKIQAGPASFRRLREQLLASVGGGSQDLIWDASLTFKETSTDVHKFLGSAKYEPVLQAIYAGLGIPQSLAGGGGGGGGMTNNALSLKTLIERLTYARNVLLDFWERELHLIQRAFGDRQPALMKFDLLSLSDEANERQMWINLWDRDVVSLETLREKLGLLPEIEFRRIQYEYTLMASGEVPHKIGPFVEPATHPDALAKAGMMQGTLAPTEAGVKKKPKARGDKSLLDHQAEQQQATLDLQKKQMEEDAKMALRQQKVAEKQGEDLHQQKLVHNDDAHKQKLAMKKTESKGQPGQGRPRGTKDGAKRKAKVVNPRVAKAEWVPLQVFAREAQKAIAEHAGPAYLAGCSKKNMRQLTADEAAEFESLKFRILCSVEPGAGVDRAFVESSVATPPAPQPDFEGELSRLAEVIYGGRGRPADASELRELHASAYASVRLNTGD